jgi:ankyrin repeat protein
MACKLNHSVYVIQALVTAYPTILQETDNNGLYALHYACIVKQSEAVIQLLMNTYPIAV